MLIAYDNSFEKYNIEDGNFATEEKVYKNQQETIEGYGVKLYENFYVEKALSNGSTLRIFKNREEVNKVCLMKEKCRKKSEKSPLTECMQIIINYLLEIH